jgi:FkbM family methyltransferase
VIALQLSAQLLSIAHWRGAGAYWAARFLFRGCKARFRDQKAEFAAIKKHVRPGDTVCDIGAYKGSYVFWLSRWCGSGRLVAFEPQGEIARNLEVLCKDTKLDNVRVEEKAAYSRTGKGTLYVPKDNLQGASMNCKFRGRSDRYEVEVPVVSLDEYFKSEERVTVLKIDVEGVELKVFKGAERILREHSPLLVFECENRHLGKGGIKEVFSYLHEKGYEGSFVCKNKLLPLNLFLASEHQNELDWKNKRLYCNNFVFAKPSSIRPQPANPTSRPSEKL